MSLSRSYIAWAVGRMRISLSDTLCGREPANPMTSAMSSGRSEVEATNSSVLLWVSSWVMWLASSVATAPGSTTFTRMCGCSSWRGASGQPLRPHLVQVDRGDAVEAAGQFIGGIGERQHDAGVVEGHVEPAELGDGAIDARGDLILVGDIAPDRQHPMALGTQLVGRGAQRLLVDICEHHGGAALGERAGGVEPHAATCAGDEPDLAAEVVRRVHADRPPAYCSSVTCSPQVTGLPDSSFCCMAMWAMKRLGAAPCQ